MRLLSHLLIKEVLLDYVVVTFWSTLEKEVSLMSEDVGVAAGPISVF